MFSKHHYLDHAHNNAARVYLGYLNGELAGFISLLPQVGKGMKNQWRVHRLVVLPDYQGVGLGIKLLMDIADLYKEEGLMLRIVTSSPSLLKALNRDNSGWRCINFGRSSDAGGIAGNIQKKRNKEVKIVSTVKRISGSFVYDKKINNK